MRGRLDHRDLSVRRGRAVSGGSELHGRGRICTSSSTTVDVHVTDATPPSGSISIAGGAAYTKTTAVTVATAATDSGSGLSQVALSNDGVSWTTRAYAPSQAWTLPATNGTRTVHVKWRDQAGNWSAVKTDTIVLDTVGPTVTAPRRGFVAGTAISAGNISLWVPWSGSDATSGIARYELAQSTDDGPWTTVSTTLTGPGATRSLATQHRYRFRVRGIDKAGNTGDVGDGRDVPDLALQRVQRAISYAARGRRSRARRTGAVGPRKSSTAGARASISITGRSIAWVARTGPDRGQAAVYVNGSKVATVDLYASSPTASGWCGSAAGRRPARARSPSGWPAPAAGRASISTRWSPRIR